MQHRLRILIEKELLESSRNRLIQGFGLVFFVLALTMSVIGFISPGAADLQFSRVGVSLLNLATLLVPLMALVVGSQGFATEFEDGTMDLLLMQPVRLSQICLGRILGQWVGIAAALLIGFGASGLTLVFLSSDRSIMPYLVNIATSLALALIFLVLGTVISLKAKNRQSALFTALGLWFFLIILYDVIIVQVLMATSGAVSMALLYGLAVLNPADILRILALRLTQVQDLFGPATEAMIALPGFKGPLAAAAAWLIWCGAGYWLAVASLKRRVVGKRRRKRLKVEETKTLPLTGLAHKA